MSRNLCIGIHFDLDQVKAVLADVESGEELSSSVFEYPRWKSVMYCIPEKNKFVQHPLDYMEGLEYTIQEVLDKVYDSALQIKAISVCASGSVVAPFDQQMRPLCFLPEFARNPNAMFTLWKDGSAQKDAESLKQAVKNSKIDYTMYTHEGCSPDWFWAKILHILRTDEQVQKAAYTWIELCDWITALLTGVSNPKKVVRSRSTAAHKALWNGEWGGLPGQDFLSRADPLLIGMRERLYEETYTSDHSAGNLSLEWAKKLGLNTLVRVGTGGMSSCFAALGGELRPGYFCSMIGPSYPDTLVVSEDPDSTPWRHNIHSLAMGSVLPGLLTLEAGQSAFGELIHWYREFLLWPLMTFMPGHDVLIEEFRSQMIEELCNQAASLPPGGDTLLAMQWSRGRKSVDRGVLAQSALCLLSRDATVARIFHALVEAISFETRKSFESFKERGIHFQGGLMAGGIAKKYSFMMQTLANVLGLPIHIIRTDSPANLGALIYASVVAEVYASVEEARNVLAQGMERTYTPDPVSMKLYDQLYARYQTFSTLFDCYRQKFQIKPLETPPSGEYELL